MKSDHISHIIYSFSDTTLRTSSPLIVFQNTQLFTEILPLVSNLLCSTEARFASGGRIITQTQQRNAKT